MKRSTKAEINFPETFLQVALTTIISILSTVWLAKLVKQGKKEQGSNVSRGS